MPAEAFLDTNIFVYHADHSDDSVEDHIHFYDALIVAAAMSAGCTTLYSEDFQHGQQFGSLTVLNPFIS